MSFFTGEYECKLDAKGRLVLPSRIKSHLPETSGNEVVLRRGLEPCLVLYPLVEYKKIFSKIAGLSEFNEEYRSLQRNFFRGDTTVELDGMGRFLIPKLMLQYASIDKDAVVTGVGNRIEIWNPDTYNQYMINDSAEFSKLIQKHIEG